MPEPAISMACAPHLPSAAVGRILLHDAAFADGASPALRTGISLTIEDGKIAWIGPNDSADKTLGKPG